MPQYEFTELIKNSGFTPVQRDSLYNEINWDF
jgi:2-iminoacetate synthase ThiH